MSNYLVSLIRTVAPAVVGAFLSWLALHGLGVPAGERESITAAVTALAVIAYYAVVRALEHRWPKLGVLLGVPQAPQYGSGSGHGSRPGEPHPSPTRHTAPDIGRTVHYVPTGTDPATCHAALITAVPAAEVTVSLFVAAPTGTSFVPASGYDPAGRNPGSWHWPPADEPPADEARRTADADAANES